MMKNIKEQIRNIRVAMETMESNNDLSRANRIILELGLETLEGLVQKFMNKKKNNIFLDFAEVNHLMELIDNNMDTGGFIPPREVYQERELGLREKLRILYIKLT